MVNYACVFSQSELGKYFEWIITYIILKMQKLEKFTTEKAPIHVDKQKLIRPRVSVSWCKNKETKKR